ncbi:MAG: tyrosine-type recombinase/integrase [Bacillota bacterium]
MPRLIHGNPKYRKHRASGQAVVTLDGRDFYLGPYGSKASRVEYDRLVSEWLANGRRLHAEKGRSDATVFELIKTYWQHCKATYRKPDGSPSGELACQRMALKVLARLYGYTQADDFGPLALRTLQHEMIQLGWCRGFINQQTKRVRRMFKWAVGQELVPSGVFHGLQAVEGLRRGRTEARETEPVKPVPEAQIAATLKHVAPPVAAMINLQLLTGMRPGEVVIMRGVDIDTTGNIWVYRPQWHKTQHHGHAREIWLGPQATKIVQQHMKPDLSAYLFSPQDAEAWRYAQASHHRRKNQKPNAKKTTRTLRERYDKNSYGRAIAYACEKAFPLPEPLQRRVLPSDEPESDKVKRETKKAYRARLTAEEKAQIREWRRAHRWHPHQLRHNAATRLRKEFGLEVARIILGHKSAAITEVYAEQDRERARQIMGQVG